MDNVWVVGARLGACWGCGSMIFEACMFIALGQSDVGS